MIIKAWVCFDDMDVVSVCAERKKECGPDYKCKKYVIKFIEIEESIDDINSFNNQLSIFNKSVTNFNKEMDRINKKIKVL